MPELTPFHLAIPVRDLAAARAFYGGLLGCDEGRSSAEWVDFNFFGHQLVCHALADGEIRQPPKLHSSKHRPVGSGLWQLPGEDRRQESP